MRTLSRRELNRALLARQLLLERGRVPISRALEKVDGLQDRPRPGAALRDLGAPPGGPLRRRRGLARPAGRGRRSRYRDGRIELEPFGRLDAADRRALREEAARLAAMHL